MVLSTHGDEQPHLCQAILNNAGFSLHLIRDGSADGDYLLLGTKESI